MLNKKYIYKSNENVNMSEFCSSIKKNKWIETEIHFRIQYPQ